MKLALTLLFGFLFTSVHGQMSNATDNTVFHEPLEEEITISSIDSTSLSLYYLLKFQFASEEVFGKLLISKSESLALTLNTPVTLKLCDPNHFRDVIGSKSIVDKESANRINQTIGDTIDFPESLMLNMAMLEDNGDTIVDFANTANEKVFEICK